MCFHYGSPDGQLLNPAFKLSSLLERKYNFLFYSKVENVMKPQIFFSKYETQSRPGTTESNSSLDIQPIFCCLGGCFCLFV